MQEAQFNLSYIISHVLRIFAEFVCNLHRWNSCPIKFLGVAETVVCPLFASYCVLVWVIMIVVFRIFCSMSFSNSNSMGSTKKQPLTTLP